MVWNKMFRVIGAGVADPVTDWNNWVMAMHFSVDGIHCGEPVAKSVVSWTDVVL